MATFPQQDKGSRQAASLNVSLSLRDPIRNRTTSSGLATVF